MKEDVKRKKEKNERQVGRRECGGNPKVGVGIGNYTQ